MQVRPAPHPVFLIQQMQDHRAAALNLRTLIRRGLTRSAGTWRLATA